MVTAYSHSYKLCGFFPVRLGASIVSLFQFICGTLVASFLWVIIDRDVHTFDTVQKYLAFLLMISNTVFAIISLFGFMGVLTRGHSLVAIYAHILAWFLGVHITLVIFAIITLFRRSNAVMISGCINGSFDHKKITACQNIPGFKVAFVVFWILFLCIELYGCVIVSHYVVQLQEQRRGNREWRERYLPTSSSRSIDMHNDDKVMLQDNQEIGIELPTYPKSSLSPIGNADADV